MQLPYPIATWSKTLGAFTCNHRHATTKCMCTVTVTSTQGEKCHIYHTNLRGLRRVEVHVAAQQVHARFLPENLPNVRLCFLGPHAQVVYVWPKRIVAQRRGINGDHGPANREGKGEVVWQAVTTAHILSSCGPSGQCRPSGLVAQRCGVAMTVLESKGSRTQQFKSIYCGHE